MRIEHHVLPVGSINCQYTLSSMHYGAAGGRKIYLQAGLHADEVPGVLVLHHLRAMLAQAEAEGKLQAEIVVVPMANPIGLAQTFMHDQLGRFDFATGSNFNRSYPDLAEKLLPLVRDALSDDAAQNQRVIRAGMLQLLDAVEIKTPLDAMRVTLMRLAHDADVVLDLHCDWESVMHIYTATDYLAEAEQLGRYLEAQAILVSDAPGGSCFDEMLFKPWLYLRQQLGQAFPVPPSCFAATVELRGEADVSHAYASADAQAIYHYLCAQGAILQDAPALPAARCVATPLAGSVGVSAPEAGVIAFLKRPGDWIRQGDAVCEIINPISGATYLLVSPVEGVMYASMSLRYATRGMELARIAGAVAIRSGYLLGA